MTARRILAGVVLVLAGCGTPDAGTGAGTSTGGTGTTTSTGGSSVTGLPPIPTTGVVDPTEGEFVPLIDPMAWMPVPAPQDPLAAHRPADVDCPLGGWLFEPQGFEINTLQCNYAMFSQPSQAAVIAGSRVIATLYHFDLLAPEPASAHVALVLGDVTLWETEVAIPGKANAFAIDVVVDTTIPAGTPLYFHLHNHGQNTWTLGAIEVEVFAG